MKQQVSFSIPDYVIKAVRLLNKAGYEAWIVGGAVRSMILNLPVHDYDITTSALPEETEQAFQEYRIIETGLKHGTITVLIDRHSIEVTTYRTETTYKDHRHPDQVHYTASLEKDCARRDLTINALCYHPDYGLKDFYGGLNDIQNKIIRAIGNPEDRFEEDALRILRAVRFASQLGFEIEPDTEKAVFDHCSELSYVSKERISEELTKTIEAPYFKDVLLPYKKILIVIIPQLHAYTEEQWQNIHTSICRSAEDPVIRMAVLLSPLNDASESSMILKTLKYPNAYITQVTDLLSNRNLPVHTRIDIRHVLSHIHVPFETFLQYKAAVNPSIDTENVQHLYNQILLDQDCFSLKSLDLNGSDLKKAGLSGKNISDALHQALNAVMNDEVPNNKEALLQYLHL